MPMLRPTMTLTLFLSSLAACANDPAGPALPPPDRAVDSVLETVTAARGVPGMVAAVVRADGIEALGAAGVRRLGGHAALTTSDRFHLGSNTKAMTATMLATLVEQGVLQWSTTPLETFPELAATIHPDHAAVTLTDLLQHRAGIEPLTSFTQVPPLPGTPRQQRRLGSGLLLELPPPVPVGSYLYSNGDYGIAAAMAEARTEQSWEELMQSRLLRPLGLRGTFGWPAASDPDQPWGHDRVGDTFVPHAPNLPADTLRMPPAIAPAGNLALCILDYARFLQVHLRGLRGRDGFLPASAIARLHQPTGHYSMGWGEVEIDGVRTATHDGTTGTFWATAWIQSGRDLAVAVLVNAGGERAAAAATEAATALLRRYGGTVPSAGVAAVAAGR
jgi:D-alanyl-D-alanine carboxypeptidase